MGSVVCFFPLGAIRDVVQGWIRIMMMFMIDWTYWCGRHLSDCVLNVGPVQVLDRALEV